MAAHTSSNSTPAHERGLDALTSSGFSRIFEVMAPEGARDLDDAVRLEAAAEAALAEGDLERALDHAGEAAGIFFENKHAGIAGAVALEAEVLVRAKHVVAPFSELGPLPDAVVEEIAFAALGRARETDPQTALGILTALRTLLLERLGESHPAAVRVLAGIANTHRELGNHDGRRQALNALVASFDCIGAMPQVAETLIQRGLAELELGELSAALATHEEALSIAAELGNPELETKCRSAVEATRARQA